MVEEEEEVEKAGREILEESRDTDRILLIANLIDYNVASNIQACREKAYGCRCLPKPLYPQIPVTSLGFATVF